MKLNEFDSFVILVEAAKKKKKKVKQRSRGKCVFPYNDSRLKDHSKDRYPINNESQAKAALRYAGKQKSAPWFRGTVEQMRKAVENAVYRAYPALKKRKEEREKKSAFVAYIFEKYADKKHGKCEYCDKEDDLHPVHCPSCKASAGHYCKKCKEQHDKNPPACRKCGFKDDGD